MLLILILLLLFVAMGILGLLLKGLAWLLVVGLVGGCITAAYMLVSRSRA